MPPTMQRICLTAFEETKDICFDIPTIEGVKQMLARFHREVLVEHPYLSAAALLMWSFYPQFPFRILYFCLYEIPQSLILGILTCLGFDEQGVRTGSLASTYQSMYYRGYTPSNGLFSASQSYGAINHEPFIDDRQRQPAVHVFWRIVGWLCLYASLVVLLKYGY